MKTPIRIFEGPHQAHEPFWKLRDAAGNEEPEMEIYGYISEFSWFEDDVTPKKFKDDLYALGKGGPITVRIHSGGGDVFAASIIRSTMMDYPGKITVKIDGLAASAASVVAMAGNVIKMQETAYMMIHDPITMAWGSFDELKKAIDMLKEVKNGIIGAYHTKTKLDEDKISKMMSDETWMSAKKALSLGFIDDIISSGGKNVAASVENKYVVNCFSHYANVPEELLKEWNPVNVDPAQPGTPPVGNTGNQVAAERLRAEVKILKKE